MNGGSSRTERALRRRASAREIAASSLSLEVTLLGDGRETSEYAKRLEVRERLLSHPFVSHVIIPEELQDAFPNAGADDVERSAIEEADVVLCLEAPARPPLGLYTEVWSYFEFTRQARDKWYRIQPMARPEVPRFQSLIENLANDALQLIDTHDYHPDEWEDCDRITSLCERRISLIARWRLKEQQRG